MFRYFRNVDHIVLEAYENYQKGSYRNRAYIVGANGLQRLSLPLAKGKNNQQGIQQVQLSTPHAWAREHWQSIRSAYGNAPFYPYYADELAAQFEAPPALLWDFNLALLRIVFRLLQWEKTITTTSEFQIETQPDLLDLRQKITPKTYPPNVTGEPPYVFYPQVFQERHGFIANLSILDLLFCQGPQANLFL